jgi:hypothetical protein
LFKEADDEKRFVRDALMSILATLVMIQDERHESRKLGDEGLTGTFFSL